MRQATRLQRQEVMTYNGVKPSRSNPVGKHMRDFNRAHTQRDQKNDYSRTKSLDNPHEDFNVDIRNGIIEWAEEDNENYIQNYYKNMEQY